MVHDELAAARLEGRQIRVVGGHARTHLGDVVAEEALVVEVVERRPVPGRIKIHPIACLLDRNREGCSPGQGTQVGAPLQARPQQVATGATCATPDLLDRAGFAGREAGVVGARRVGDGEIVGGIVVAGARVVEHAVGHAIVRVANRDGTVGGERLLRGGHRPARILAHRDLRPDVVRLKTVPVDGGCASQDGVEILGVSLRHHQALAPTGGTTVPIGTHRVLRVIGLGELLAHHRRQVHRAVRKVFLQGHVGVTRRKHAEGPRQRAARMAGVRHHADKALAHRVVGDVDVAGIHTIALGAEPTVPIGRGQRDPDVDLWINPHLDQAVLAVSGGCARGAGADLEHGHRRVSRQRGRSDAGQVAGCGGVDGDVVEIHPGSERGRRVAAATAATSSKQQSSDRTNCRGTAAHRKAYVLFQLCLLALGCRRTHCSAGNGRRLSISDQVFSCAPCT